MSQLDGLPQIAYRGTMAAADWVDSLAGLVDITDIEDKVRSRYGLIRIVIALLSLVRILIDFKN